MKNRLTTTLSLAILLVASATVLEAGWEEGVAAFKVATTNKQPRNSRAS